LKAASVSFLQQDADTESKRIVVNAETKNDTNLFICYVVIKYVVIKLVMLLLLYDEVQIEVSKSTCKITVFSEYRHKIL